jgi:hypothetical protein
MYVITVYVKKRRLKKAAQQQSLPPVVGGGRAPAKGAHYECIPLQS